MKLLLGIMTASRNVIVALYAYDESYETTLPPLLFKEQAALT
jgi:hypothetical protein